MKSSPTTPKTKDPEKKIKKSQIKKIRKNGTSIDKKKPRKKKAESKKEMDGLKQVSVKDLILKCEKEGQDLTLGQPKKKGKVGTLREMFEKEDIGGKRKLKDSSEVTGSAADRRESGHKKSWNSLGDSGLVKTREWGAKSLSGEGPAAKWGSTESVRGPPKGAQGPLGDPFSKWDSGSEMSVKTTCQGKNGFVGLQGNRLGQDNLGNGLGRN